MKARTSLLILFAALLCQASVAQNNTSSSTSSSAAAKAGTDTVTLNFIQNATIANMKEITTSKLAQKNAQDPRVKTYAAEMIQHHTMASQQLTALVSSKKIALPDSLTNTASPDSTLNNLAGTKFDQTYVTMMIGDHRKAVALFAKASTNVPDPDVKAFAVKTLPLLRRHLSEIELIAAKMNITGQ